jgi:uncharacterized protein (TIGR01777 family)
LNCESITGDPSIAGPWLDKLAESDAIIHLAGEPILARRWRAKFRRRLYDSRVQSTKLIAETLAKQPRCADGSPKVFVCASAIGWYGIHDNEELDEDDPPGSDFLAELCKDWEAAAQPAIDAGLRVTNVRVGMVLDATGGALPKLARPFYWFLGGPIASGKQWVSWIHHADMAGILLLALDNPDARGPINATAPEPLTNWGFCKTLGKVLHRPCWLRVPRFMVWLMLGKASSIVTTGQRAIPRRAAKLGYDYRFPQLEGALQDLLGKRQ